MVNETPNESNEQPSPNLPLVEPSDSVQTGEPSPPPASLVEPSQLIQKSDDRYIVVDIDTYGDVRVYVDPRALRLLPSVWGNRLAPGQRASSRYVQRFCTA